MNNIVLQGRLVYEPELKQTKNGIDVTSLRIAVKRDSSKDDITDFIDCTAWRRDAVFVNNYFHRGDGILVWGSLETKNYTDKNGNNRTEYKVNISHSEFPLSSPSKKTDNSYINPSESRSEPTSSAIDNITEIDTKTLADDEDMPF